MGEVAHKRGTQKGGRFSGDLDSEIFFDPESRLVGAAAGTPIDTKVAMTRPPLTLGEEACHGHIGLGGPGVHHAWE
jgi:hypothetical protein